MKRAIVLQGGGSKGSYQMGVWKALKKLKIKYDIVCGTSIGSVNAAFMVQGKYYTALAMWKTINYNYIFDKEYKNEIEIIKSRLVTKGGLDVTNFENILTKYLNKNKFYNSPIDFGLVTVNMKNMKPLFLSKKNIPRDKLIDYIRASCNLYPVFTKKDIDGNSYIDGGFRDNLPINFAVKMGAEEIIAVELDSVGITTRVRNKKIKIIKIKPKSKLGPTINFNKEMINRNINLGYNDTLKVYNKLDGDFYSFKKNHLHINYLKYKNLFVNNISVILNNDKNKEFIKMFSKIVNYRIFINKDEVLMEQKFNEIIEIIARSSNVEEDIIYNINYLNKILIKIFNEERTLSDNLTTKDALASLLTILSRKELINYIYDNIKYNYYDNYNKIINLSTLFPKEFLSALYLLTVEGYRFYE